MPKASNKPAGRMLRTLVLVLRVGMVTRALNTMTSRLPSAGTSSKATWNSSPYMNRPTTSSAQTMHPMHSDALDALMRRLEGSSEKAVCSTSR